MPIRISISGNYYIFSVAISGIIWDVKYTNIIYVQLELAKDTTQLQMALGHVYKPERLRLKDLQCSGFRFTENQCEFPVHILRHP